MDQNAFRSLLASGSGSGTGGKPKSRGVLGGPAPKRGGWGIKSKPGHEYKPPADETKPSTTFTPRHATKKDPTAGKYVDRAELRRQGKDDEYKSVEQLLTDLEKRQKEEGFDKEEIEKQRAYLGGDATHSILVKGLDHALLAKTRAELAAKGEEVADDELEAIALDAQGKKRKNKVKEGEKGKEGEEKVEMAKGFKSIAKTGEATGEKKKKKKKKVKVEQQQPKSQLEQGQGQEVKRESEAASDRVSTRETVKQEEMRVEAGPSRPVKKEPTPVDDDDDIFGDAGGYDLTAGREDEDSSDEDDDEEEGEAADARGDGREPRSRSWSRSRSRSRERERRRDDPRDRYRDDRRRSEEEYRRRERSTSYDRYDRRDRRSISRDYEQRRRYSPSPDTHGRYDRRHDSRDRYDDRRYGSRDEYDDRRGKSYSRERSYSPERSYPRERHNDRRDDRRDDYHSRRPYSRSPSPPPKRPRQKTRSPSPMTFDFTGRPPSLTPSDDSEADEDDHIVGGKLQPLKSSALQDVKGYLSLDAQAAKDDERRAKKAKWRARQGLGVQEGAEKFLERDVGDKEKANRDYVNIMNKIKKDEGADGKGKSEG